MDLPQSPYLGWILGGLVPLSTQGISLLQTIILSTSRALIFYNKLCIKIKTILFQHNDKTEYSLNKRSKSRCQHADVRNERSTFKRAKNREGNKVVLVVCTCQVLKINYLQNTIKRNHYNCFQSYSELSTRVALTLTVTKKLCYLSLKHFIIGTATANGPTQQNL